MRDGDGNTLNVIEFASDPSLDYTFSTRDANGVAPILTKSLVVPPRGGSESNPFLATANPDSFTGSASFDWASYAGSTLGVEVNLSTYPATVADGWAASDTLSGINNLIGSDHGDTLTGNDDSNVLRGGAGDDVLSGGAGNDYLDGGSGDDILEGGAGNDIIGGGEGDDYLYGGAGNDRLAGYRGADTIYGGAGTDTYVFSEHGDGTDTIVDETGDTMTLRFSNGYSYGSYKAVNFEAVDFVDASNNFNRVGNNLEITIDQHPDDGITEKITIRNAYNDDPNIGTGNSAFTINIGFGRSGSYTEVTNDFWHTLTLT